MMPPGPIVAFETALPGEHRRLLRYFNRRVGREAAPDLVQEAFARLFGSGPLERIENPQAYLTRIARNLLIDRARKRSRDRTILYPLDEDRDATVYPEQAWRLEAMDLLRVYRKAIRAMPRKTRRIFLMHRFRGLTYREIAGQLDISVPTVEYHMVRALALCRGAIAAQG